jgi:hypothetical protein
MLVQLCPELDVLKELLLTKLRFPLARNILLAEVIPKSMGKIFSLLPIPIFLS